MSTRAKREGHTWIEGEMRAKHSQQDEWLITKQGTHANGFHSIRHEYNLEPWVRFSEFNRLSYHHIWLLSPEMQELNKKEPWRVHDLKKAWRDTLLRIKLCKRPKLPGSDQFHMRGYPALLWVNL